MAAPELLTAEFDTPIGRLGVGVTESGVLAAVGLPCHDPLEGRPSRELTVQVVTQFEEYFAGERQHFTLQTRTVGSAWQRRVWVGLCAIPYGQTRSYGELAEEIGRAGAARAVGGANRANPLPIVVPCHRVVGADGSIGGYAGLRGVEIKRTLLALERAHAS